MYRRVAWLLSSSSSSSSSTSTATSDKDRQFLGYSLSYPSIIIHAICKDTKSFPEPCIFCQVDPSLNPENDNNIITNTANEHDYRRDIELSSPEAVYAASHQYDIQNHEQSSSSSNISETTTTNANLSSTSNNTDSNLLPYESHPDDIRLIPPIISDNINDNTDILDTIFNTLSSCASLHPDPMDEDDEDGNNNNGLFSMMNMMMMMMNRGANNNDDNDEGNNNYEAYDSMDNNYQQNMEGVVFSAEQLEQLQHYDNLLIEETENNNDDHPIDE